MASPLLPYSALGFVGYLVLLYFLPSSIPTWLLLLPVVVMLVNNRYRLMNSIAKKKRKLSFMTDTLAKESFPRQYNIPAPVITGVLTFNTLPSVDDVIAALTPVLAMPIFERLKMIVKGKNNSADFQNDDLYWAPFVEDDEKVSAESRAVDGAEASRLNLRKQIYEHTVENSEELQKKINGLLVAPLDKRRPLWDMHLIQNKQGESTVIWRFHHVIGDGLALVQLMFHAFTSANAEPISIPFLNAKAESDSKPKEHAKQDPAVLLKKALFVGQLVAKVPLAVFKLATLAAKNDSAICLRNHDTNASFTRREAFVLPNIPLSDIKTVKNKFNVTVNDVMVSCVAGAVRRYMEAKNDPALKSGHPLLVRVMMPFSFINSPPPFPLRNNWTLLSLALPVDVASSDPVARLKLAKQGCDALKSSPEAAVNMVIQELLSAVPFSVSSKIVFDLMMRHTAVFSNVPGPTNAVKFAGQEVLNMYPLFTNLINQAMALSYKDQMTLNLVVDPAHFGTPQTFFDGFMQELASLKQANAVSLSADTKKIQ